MSGSDQENYVGLHFIYMRKYRLEDRSEVVLDANYTAETAWFCLQYERRHYLKKKKIAKLYSDILALVCRRFVAYILSLLSCGKLRNTTALPVSALEIVAACLLAISVGSEQLQRGHRPSGSFFSCSVEDRTDDYNRNHVF
jgi:hypothetical protein